MTLLRRSRVSLALCLLAGLTTTALSSLLATDPAGPGIRLSTVGYLPDVAKVATVVGAEDATEFALIDSTSGEVRLTGALGPLTDSPATQEQARAADFSALTAPGTYLLRVDGLPDSTAFTVSPSSLNASLDCMMAGFYGQRCGQAVTLTWNGETYHYEACHLDDGYLDYNDPAKKGERQDGTGGWHDAGDYGKYTINSAFTCGVMLAAWEQHQDKLAQLQLPQIPEHGGDLPDYLAELKYNLDWQLKMQLPNGEVAHKLTTLHFIGMVMPTESDLPRYYSPNSRYSTETFAALAGMTARVFAPFDAAYAQTWLDAGRRAWIAARAMPIEHPDISMFSTGGYFSDPASNHRWGLIEMRLAFGADFLTTAEQAELAATLASTEEIFETDWGWGNVGNLGLLSWMASDEAAADPTALAHLQADLRRSADEIVERSHTHVYGRGVHVNFWGVNGAIANNAVILDAAYRLTGEAVYRDTAFNQVAYLYGRNPFARSFITGDGHEPPMGPHHRPSEGDGIVAPWPGHLVGGPNPTEIDWFDEMPSYRTNENAINWDASMVYALAMFYHP